MIRKKGFTLVEISVLLVFIGILAGAVYFSLDIVKAQAVDSKRVTELKQIAKALEEYYDKHAKYPLVLEELVSDGRMLYVPTPTPYGSTERQYIYVALGDYAICTGYHLGVPLETNDSNLSNDADAKPGKACPGSSSYDFDGMGINCLGSRADGADNCYDIKI